MKKTLTSLITSTILGLSSCTPFLKNDRMIYESEPSQVLSSETNYQLPIVTIAGKNLNPQKPSRQTQEGELEIIFKPYGTEKSFLIKNRKNNHFDLETETVYILPRYLIPKSAESTEMVPGNEFVFDMEGTYALKARLKNPNLNKKGIETRTITNRNIEYEIQTIKIDIDREREGLEEFYVGVILDKQGNIKERILFEVESTQDLINTQTGQLILRNPNMYQLKEIPTQEYNSRPEIIKEEVKPEEKETNQEAVKSGNVRRI